MKNFLKNILLYTITFLIFISCKSLKNGDLIGTYQYKSKISTGKLTLNSDTFYLQYDAPLMSYTSSGKWNLKRNKIILESDNIYKNNFIEVQEKISNTDTYIQIFDENNYPIELAGVIINNDGKYLETDKNGKINLTNLTIKKIKFFEIYNISLTENKVHIVKSPAAKVFSIKIIPIDYTKKYFENSAYNISKNIITIGKQKYIKI